MPTIAAPVPATPPAGRPAGSRVRLIARVVLVPYLVFVALVVFLPAPDADRVTGLVWWTASLLAGWGLPLEPTAVVLEFVANIALFVPIGLLARLALPRVRAWVIVLAGCLASTTIELVQLAIPSRYSTVSDVIANTLGTLAGVGLVALVASVGRRRSRR